MEHTTFGGPRTPPTATPSGSTAPNEQRRKTLWRVAGEAGVTRTQLALAEAVKQAA